MSVYNMSKVIIFPTDTVYGIGTPIFDLEGIKSELKDYITLEIRKEYNEEIERVNKRLIKEKNKSIIWKNILKPMDVNMY